MAFPRTLNLSAARISGVRVLDIGAGGGVKDDSSPLLKVICGRTRFVRSSLFRADAVVDVFSRLSNIGGKANAATIRRWLLIAALVVVVDLPTTA